MDLEQKKILWIWETGCNADTTAREKNERGHSRTSALQLEQLQVRQCSLGKSCAAVLSEDDKIYQMGNTGATELTLSGIESTLREVSLLRCHQVTEVACGYHHVAVVVQTGAVYCWGTSTFGQCGVVADLVDKPNRMEVVHKKSLVAMKNVTCGKYHTMALSRDCEVWGWGISHMIGSSSNPTRNTPRFRPEIVKHLCGRKVLQISCGKKHTVALAEKIRRSGSSVSKPDAVERCEKCGQEIYKWGHMELTMLDSGDEVVITDGHVCPQKATESTDLVKPEVGRVKSSSHVRSLSLPFLKKNSPLSVRSEKLGGVSTTPPTQLELPLHILSSKQKVLSESNLHDKLKISEEGQKETELENLKAEIDSSENISSKNTSLNAEKVDFKPKEQILDPEKAKITAETAAEKDSIEKTAKSGALVSSIHSETGQLLNLQDNIAKLPKSASMPVDLWKNGQREIDQVFLFPSKLIADDSSSFSCTPPGSSSASLASLEEFKSRMTVQTSTDTGMNIDPESAISYLNRITPDGNGNSMDFVPTDPTESTQNFVFESTVHLENNTKHEDVRQDSTSKRTISERITKSITENQLLSPLTSYSKNVFTGVMDHIEWIKSSTYEKGVAPIRELWSKDKDSKQKNEDIAQEVAYQENAELNEDDAFVSTFHNPLQGDAAPMVDAPTSSPSAEVLTLQTEIWSWGENDYGQLGQADQLDRFQPTCIKSLSHRGVVKIRCGADHTVALTGNSQVYTWGRNEHGQLGHEETSTRSPTLVECKGRVWDVAAGRYHTLMMADGPSQKPNIYVCGNDQSKEMSSSHPLQSSAKTRKCKDWKLRSVEFSHKMGFQSTVISGFSTLSSCLTENNCSSFTVTLHEFAKAEREFYRQIMLIKIDVFQPMQFSDLQKVIDGTVYGDMLSKTLDLFAALSYNIGLNTLRLTQSVVFAKNPEIELFSYVGELLMSSFERYFEALNNMVAYGFFEKCDTFSTKRSKFLSQEKLTEIFKKLLSEKRFSKSSTENLLQVMLLPALRIREYSNILNRIAVSVEENISLGIFLEKLSTEWDTLWTKINTKTRSASNTRNFWKNEFKASSGLKLAESLKKVGRHLIMHSKKVPLDVAHAGRFSYNWFILFNDCLALVHYGTHVVYPLEILWCSPITEGKEASKGIKLVTPEDDIVTVAGSEESKSSWLNAFYRAINQVTSKEKESPRCSRDGTLHRSPSQNRNASYTFTKDPELKGARYVGAWMNGKPHGKGKMTWEDGRTYKGNYRNGLQNGFGEWKAANNDTTKLKYHGWWKDGKMDGFGKLWYSRYQTYEGHFTAGLREGYGTLRTGSVTEGSVYVGGWKKDQRDGFGVEDNITKGEKYLGMWSNDHRQGVGILVTLDGLYGQSRFTNGEMNGDALLIEGRYVFEGHVSAGMVLYGKGRLTLPTGDKFEGTFSGPWGENIRISGNLVRIDINRPIPLGPESPKTPIDVTPNVNSPPHRDHAKSILRRYNRNIMKKHVESPKHGRSFPLTLHPDLKWTQIFHQCRELLGYQDEDNQVSVRKVWEAISVSISNARQRKEILQQAKASPMKKIDEKKLRWLEHVPSFVKLENDDGEGATNGANLSWGDVQGIQEYLRQSFSTSLHPLGELADSLGNVFRDSYSGAGAHKCLLTQAVADVRSFVRRTYDIIRFMFPQLNKEYGSSHMKVLNHQVSEEESANSHSDELSHQVTAGDLLLPVLLPRVYPTLFTLYALQNEAEDRSYWERVTRLNRHPDVALLSFLGVKPKFWLLDDKAIPALETSPEDGQLYENEEQAESSKWRHLLVARARDCSFLSAVETLQLISTTFIPAEKLNVIHSTFKEINATVMEHLHTKHSWSMDDLFPVFQYVVIRSRISHLGCEIQLVEDFLEPDMCKGEKGIMFTTLKACYFQIRMEKDL